MKKTNLTLLLGVTIITLCGCSPSSSKETEPENQTIGGSVTMTATPTSEPTATLCPTQTPTPTPTPTPGVIETLVYEENFESGVLNFTPRGTETIELSSTDAYDGTTCMLATNRTSTWHGPSIDVTDLFTDHKKIRLHAWVKYEGEGTSNRIYVKVTQNGSNYLNFGSVMAKKGVWTELKGNFEVPEGTTSAQMYFESEYNSTTIGSDTIDIYVDQIELYEITVPETVEDLPSLAQIHQDYFKVGVALTTSEFDSKKRVNIITSQFNSMTAGNDMKPENILDYYTCSNNLEKCNLKPALNFMKADKVMDFAKEHGLALRGHTLVWHSQTPRWFFTENYSQEADAPLASKEVMIARMESYIQQVLTHCQENYPGLIYAWDVVNEAINPGDGVEGGYRSSDSLWYQTIGPEFVELAFSYARKYADPEVKLIYNDFNCYQKNKLYKIYDMCSGLVEKGILDGIGLQSHIGFDQPTLMEYESAITKLASLGVEIQVTELDVNLDDNSAEKLTKLGTRYKKLFTLYRHLNDTGKANITSVTLWGLSDELSWLNDDVRKYPLLFDDFLQAKEAFYGACLDDSIPLY